MTYRLPSILLAGFLALCSIATSSQAQTPAVTPPAANGQKPIYVVLKLDDLTSNTPNWIRVVDYLKEKNVKCGIGIICNSLEKDNPAYFDWVKQVQAGGLVEFWNHGYDHKEWMENGAKVQEFKGPAYEQQKEHFAKAQQLAKDKLGITMHSFGAPFNTTDDNTVKVLSEDPDIKAFMYGNPKDAATLSRVMIEDRTQMNIENPIFVPNAAKVEHDYNILSQKRDFFVIQGHANQWDAARFEEFKKMVEFLISKGVTFVTPYELYLLKTDGGKNPPPAPLSPPIPTAPPTPVAATPTAPSAPQPAGEVLTNGGLEAGTTGWEIYIPTESSEANCTFEGVKDGVHGGTQAGKLNSQVDGRYCALQYPKGLSYNKGDRYRISAWIKAGPDFKPKAGTPGFAIRITMFGTSEIPVTDGGLYLVGTDGKATRGKSSAPLNDQAIPSAWTKVEGVYEISDNTAKMNVCVFVWVGSGSFFFDDVSLEKVPNDTPLSKTLD